MSKDQKWNFTAVVISFVLSVLTTMFVLQFIPERNITIACILSGIAAVIFTVSYTIIYIIPKAILRIRNSKKEEKNLAKIKHVSIEKEI